MFHFLYKVFNGIVTSINSSVDYLGFTGGSDSVAIIPNEFVSKVDKLKHS